MTTDDETVAPRLQLAATALINGSDLALAALPRETGGILVGWYDGDTVVVTDVLPVLDKRAGGHHYSRNHKRAQRVLNQHRKQTADKNVGYVGEWHSHPAPHPPSRVDLDSLAELTEVTDQTVALVVFAVNADGAVSPLGAAGRRHGRTVTIQELVVESEPS
ncbi:MULTISPECIES: Mov34/MPN/PAD-1 family protein [unclassified Nocardioides]|uniref:Mov34/MPN/PAD-1 family protein n=1 Tax=unclassified Nocardioides TaxID=2615069 RepID=UPI000AC5D5A5|nr:MULTISPECIES: Mov34/MPN/PAD-1 family protein [unclassified Nocardioides]